MKKLTAVISLIVSTLTITAQNVGIGTATPNVNAALDINHSSKGLLIPRMDSVSRKNIPATNGLMVYDSTSKCFWYHDGTRWVNMPPKGNSTGDVLYWNGSAWAVLPAGSSGQYLALTATGTPAWATVNTSGTSSNIATQSVSNIAPTTVQCGGIITSDGGASITARGVVWGTSTNPTIALATKTNDGTGVGTYISSPTGLQPATTYYIRAYYTNANGTTYGNQVSFTTISTFSIGQTYGGGTIFYIDNTGQHGLIVSPNDLSGGITWNNTTQGFIQTNAAGLAIGTGYNNTSIIVNAQGAGSFAASLCRLFYNEGGFTDWHLPSLYELNQLNLASANLGLANLFGSYWSSSEIDASNCWVVFIDNTSPSPNQNSRYKDYQEKVRAVRRF